MTLDLVAKHLSSTPSRDKVIKELRARGFSASRCHVDTRALRTNARMREVLEACQGGLGLRFRAGSDFVSSSTS